MLAELKYNKNKIYQGDNIVWLNRIPDESIDLCYIDPPFFTQQNFGHFEDRFAGGITHYIDWMRPRLKLIHKKLKKTGCIYLHCDWHASHYLKCEMDSIFGDGGKDGKGPGFKANIIWSYSWGIHVDTRWNRKHDDILFYSKTKIFTFNAEEVLEERNLGENSKKRLEYKGALIKEHNNRGGNEKSLPKDVWNIPTINGMARERIGYRTQKPEALLEKIIKASSNEGDIILDCFSGGFTTAKVCSDLNRKFICGDVSPVACKIGMKRLNSINFFDYELINVI